MTTLYGIKNCDTIKKAKKWLDANGIEYQFHDYREDGLEKELLENFEMALGWENLLNKRGTTFRNLPAETKEDIDRDKAIELMLEFPALIKRPVLVHQDNMMLGFKEASYQELF